MLEAWALAGLLLGPDPGIRLVLAAGLQLSLQGGLSPVDHTEAQCESMQRYINLLLAPGDVFGRMRSLLSCSDHSLPTRVIGINQPCYSSSGEQAEF